MITIKSDREIELIKEAGKLISLTFEYLEQLLQNISSHCESLLNNDLIFFISFSNFFNLIFSSNNSLLDFLDKWICFFVI